MVTKQQQNLSHTWTHPTTQLLIHYLTASSIISFCYLLKMFPLFLCHTYISFQTYTTYISWSVFSWLSLASIEKMKIFPFTKLAYFDLPISTRSWIVKQQKICHFFFFLFPFHDSLHINLCLTLIQYIQFIYATLGCRQFTFSNFLATAKLWYSTNL